VTRWVTHTYVGMGMEINLYPLVYMGDLIKLFFCRRYKYGVVIPGKYLPIVMSRRGGRGSSPWNGELVQRMPRQTVELLRTMTSVTQGEHDCVIDVAQQLVRLAATQGLSGEHSATSSAHRPAQYGGRRGVDGESER
jgi:hypothetical protein